MTNEEFNRLLNGPLAHPLALFRFNRLSIALRVVVEATGEAGEKALRDHCSERDKWDQSNEETF
jgi:hypothetical protein